MAKRAKALAPTGLKDHLAVARKFYADNFQKSDRRTLIYNNGDYYWWHNPHWQMQENLAIRTHLWTTLEAESPQKSSIDGSMDALRSVAFEPISTRAPCWLIDFPDQADPRSIIACNNGLLDIESRTMLPLTPDFFNLNYLPIDYEPDAQEPEEFIKFLASLWPDDQASIDCLQEVFGYLLTQETSQQKAFLLIGPKRSGKGTIARILTRLIGAHNVASPTLSGLVSTPYSLECLINRQLTIIGDARMSGKVDHIAISEAILGITGEDSVTIQRKYKDPWTGRLNTRFVVMTNEIPALTDASGALASRLIVLETQESFLGREDLGLEQRLGAELHGILHWALAGLDRLRARGYFLQPESGRDVHEELKRSSSPVSQFMEDECEVGPTFQIECGVLFGIFQEWSKKQGRMPSTVQRLSRDLRAVDPTIKTVQPRVDGRKDRFFNGIRRRTF